MRTALVLGTLSLVLAGAWLALDRTVSEWLREELASCGVADLVAFDELTTAVPGQATLHGATLRDPVTGTLVAHIERLDVELDTRWALDPGATPTAVRGRGGRVLLQREADAIGLVRAIQLLVERLEEFAASGEGAVALPMLVFDDLELVVFSDDHPLERYVDSSVRVEETETEVIVTVDAGRSSGRLVLTFDSDGSVGMEARGLRVTPAVGALDPAMPDIPGLEVRGALDLVIQYDPEGTVIRSDGTLRDAYVDTTYVPFPLGPSTIPFTEQDGVVTIANAVLGFEGGEVLLSVEAVDDEIVLDIDVDGAAFREQFLELVPGYHDLEGLDCSDGGSFETHLRLRLAGDPMEVSVEGSGGFHVEHAELVPPGLVLEDVVGRFIVDDQSLTLPEVSARCASGGIRGSGTIGLADDSFDMGLAIEDLDAGRLHESMREFRHMKHDIAGWLQGEIKAKGRLGHPELTTAYGQVSIRAGNLWETPLLESILLELPWVTGAPGTRHRLEAQFNILGERIFVDPLKIESEVLNLAGTGTIDFDERIDFELVPVTIPLGLVGDLIEALQQGLLVNLVITGTLRDPRVIVMPLDVVTGPIREAFEYLLGSDEEPADEEAGSG